MRRIRKLRFSGEGIQDPRSGHTAAFLSVDDAPAGFYPNMAHRTDKIDIAFDPKELLVHVKAWALRDGAWQQVGDAVSISVSLCYDIHWITPPVFPWEEAEPAPKASRAKEAT